MAGTGLNDANDSHISGMGNNAEALRHMSLGQIKSKWPYRNGAARILGNEMESLQFFSDGSKNKNSGEDLRSAGVSGVTEPIGAC